MTNCHQFGNRSQTCASKPGIKSKSQNRKQKNRRKVKSRKPSLTCNCSIVISSYVSTVVKSWSISAIAYNNPKTHKKVKNQHQKTNIPQKHRNRQHRQGKDSRNREDKYTGQRKERKQKREESRTSGLGSVLALRNVFWSLCRQSRTFMDRGSPGLPVEEIAYEQSCQYL